jgi:hypothetical protein
MQTLFDCSSQVTGSNGQYPVRQQLHITQFAFVVALLAVLVLFSTPRTAHAAAQQPVDGIARWTINGGGGSTSGNGYQLTGTMGQTDANAERLMGNGYSLRSGFWWPGDDRVRSADEYPLHYFLPALQH